MSDKETVQIQVLPHEIDQQDVIFSKALSKSEGNDYTHFFIRKRSIDARKKPVKLNLQVVLSNEEIPSMAYDLDEVDVRDKEKVHIIGAGPAGLYAAIQAIQSNRCPVVFERGKDVRARRRDLAFLTKEGKINPESNYCFGEGGAGTYSDGKLYTRSKKRGNVLKAMEWLVHFGANEDILVDAHPHIGTNKLPQLIANMRNYILKCGGEVHFNSKLTNISIHDKRINSIEINHENNFEVNCLILATGHSARDIFYLLHEKKVKIEAKGFALGVRVEHPQELIDELQYHGDCNNPYLPPASYSLVTQVKKTGVYSFCMCPGGIIAPCATADGEVVTNGWSPSKRNNPFANSGIVVSILPEDLPNYKENEPFVCLDFQKHVEHECWKAGGRNQFVPAQRLMDFVENRKSKDLPVSSYRPGTVSCNLKEVLPRLIVEKLNKGFLDFGKKMKGYLTNEAVVHAPESRTSSPVAIPRDRKNFHHIEIENLYPCGEGAGYAGGIISAAVDGMNCVSAYIAKENLENKV
jgi:uncharacterized FAD-dependent dehydrogenase